MNEPVQVGEYRCGPGHPLLWILGPCVIESRDLTLRIAARLGALADELRLPLVFKASFNKANRSSGKSFRGAALREQQARIANLLQLGNDVAHVPGRHELTLLYVDHASGPSRR